MYYDELFEKALSQAKEDNFTELKVEVNELKRNFENFLNRFFNSTTHNAEHNYNVPAM